jgi:hypothetical protein
MPYDPLTGMNRPAITFPSPQNVPLAQTPLPPVKPLGLGQPAAQPPPAGASTPGWNLFSALGTALGNIGRSPTGVPQGMTGLINPQNSAPGSFANANPSRRYG